MRDGVGVVGGETNGALGGSRRLPTGRLCGGLAVVRLDRVLCRRTSSRSGEDPADLRDAVAVSAETGARGVGLRADVLSVACRNREARSLLLGIVEAFRRHRFPAVVEGLGSSGLRVWVRTGSAPSGTLADLVRVVCALLDDAAGQAVRGGWMGPDGIAEPPLTARGTEVAFLLSPATVEEASRVLETFPPDGGQVADVLAELVAPSTLDRLRVSTVHDERGRRALSRALGSLLSHRTPTRALPDETIGRIVLAFPVGGYARAELRDNPDYFPWRIEQAREGVVPPWVDRHRAAADAAYLDPYLRAVLTAHHEHAHNVVIKSWQRYRVAETTLRIDTGFGTSKLARIHRDLIRLGWLARETGSLDTSRWWLRMPDNMQDARVQDEGSKNTRPTRGLPTTSKLHDAHRVLGVAMRTLDLLDERRPTTIDAIAETIGTEDGAGRDLRKLRRLGLAFQTDDGSWLLAERLSERLDGIAEESGWDGAAEHEANLARADQDAHARYQAWKVLTSERLTAGQVAAWFGWTDEEAAGHLDKLADRRCIDRHTDSTWTAVPDRGDVASEVEWLAVFKASPAEVVRKQFADLDPFTDECERQHREHVARYEARRQAHDRDELARFHALHVAHYITILRARLEGGRTAS